MLLPLPLMPSLRYGYFLSLTMSLPLLRYAMMAPPAITLDYFMLRHFFAALFILLRVISFHTIILFVYYITPRFRVITRWLLSPLMLLITHAEFSPY